MQEEMKGPENGRVNFAELLARVDNDLELLSELVSIFKEEFPRYFKSLEEAVSWKNIGEVASVSHTLKGMLSNLAVAGGAASAGRLEQLARRGDIASLHEAFLAFERDVEGLLAEMESYVAEARR